LKPKSTVIYEANGAEITDPRITTPAGHRVNVLVPHEEYLIRYRVAFSRSSFQVRCGTMIKNTLGTELGGMNNRSPVDHVTAGTEVELAFRFRCQLIPGVYFANVGLMGAIDGRYTFLHRMEDALMFRVIHGNNHSLVGPVDFFLESQLQFTMPSEGRKAA
jgi:lipopolysaccharide transport system ATP-binding protein